MSNVESLFDKQRKAAEKRLIDAALNLFDVTDSYGFSVPIPGTTPELRIECCMGHTQEQPE